MKFYRLEPWKLNVTVTHIVRGYNAKTELLLQKQEEIKEELMAERTAKVSVFVSRTFNLGDYESLKFDVGVTLPSAEDEIVQRTDQAKDIVHERLIEYAIEAGLIEEDKQADG